MKPTESTLLPRVLLGATATVAAGLGAPSAYAAPVAFDPADVTVAYSSTNTAPSIYFDPQTGYAGTTQAEGNGLNADFRLYLNGSAAKVSFVSVAASASNQTGQVVYNSNTYAPRFAQGTGINGGSGTFGNNLQVNLHNTTMGTYPWNPGDRGFLPLGITSNAATGGPAAVGTQLYGWAEVSYNADSSVTLYRFGYDNAGGTSFAGAVPEPGSLAAAATLGAAGLLAYRRRRAAAAAQA